MYLFKIIHQYFNKPSADDYDKRLDLIISKLDQIMNTQERFDAILSRIDTVTTDLAGDFQTFIDEYKAGTVTEESLAKAEAAVGKLEELASSKTNPIPGEETPPAEGEGG